MNEWTDEMPEEPGFYHFKCQETLEVEIVFVYKSRLEPIQKVFSDGGWNLLRIFHDNLTYPQWKRVDSRNFNK